MGGVQRNGCQLGSKRRQVEIWSCQFGPRSHRALDITETVRIVLAVHEAELNSAVLGTYLSRHCHDEVLGGL